MKLAQTLPVRCAAPQTQLPTKKPPHRSKRQVFDFRLTFPEGRRAFAVTGRETRDSCSRAQDEHREESMSKERAQESSITSKTRPWRIPLRERAGQRGNAQPLP